MIFLIFLFLAAVFGSPLDQLLNPLRIIGGHDANITDYPYQVAVFSSGTQKCGGAIIGNTTILTSAKCLARISHTLSYVQIRAGSSNRSEGGELINVKKGTSHPKFNLSLSVFEYNIAVLELETTLTYNAGIQPIQLPNNSTVLDGKYGTITGWGEHTGTYNAGIQPIQLINNSTALEGKYGTITGWGEHTGVANSRDILQVADVPISTDESCQYWSGGASGIICADGNGKYSCDGDSGGPLVVDGILQGIVATANCGFFDLQSVYTKVSAYLDFINPFLTQQ